MALRKVVLPVEVPPEIRIVFRWRDRRAQEGDRLRLGIGQVVLAAAESSGPAS